MKQRKTVITAKRLMAILDSSFLNVGKKMTDIGYYYIAKDESVEHVYELRQVEGDTLIKGKLAQIEAYIYGIMYGVNTFLMG